MNTFIWFLPILSGALDASSRLVIKETKADKYFLAGFGFLFVVPYYGLWLLVEGVPSLDYIFWLAVGVVVPIGVAASLLTIEAHRRTEFFLSAPY